MRKRVVVIGGGLGGLAAACTSAAHGHEVRLFEANAALGGKAVTLEQDGFRFDMGPTILTLPEVLERIFAEANRELGDYVELVRLDPQWRCFFEDGSTLDLTSNAQAMHAELERFAGCDSADGYERFLGTARELHRISERFFFWKSVGGLRDTLDVGKTFSAATLKDLRELRMGQSVAGTIRRAVPDARVAQMLDHFTQYVGSSPYGSPAVLCGIAHMQTDRGVWYPRGGTRAVPEALIALARELGVELETGAPVERIVENGAAVSGVQLADGRYVEADAVVSNMDTVRTHAALLSRPVAKRFERRRRYEPACSGVVLYLGLARRYEHLAHHNFVFSADPKAEFDAIYAEGRPAPDPTCYVAAPSATDSSVAPAGAEALYVLVHTPYLRPQHDWSRMLAPYRRRILEKLKSCGGMPDLEERIVSEAVLTPQDIHDRYRVSNGAIYGLASHGLFRGAFKPGNRSPDLKRLYFAGGSAHPGPGMPMALMSGWIAADTLQQDLSTADAAAAAAARSRPPDTQVVA
jgi:phytoene desaturase